jgi:ABC-type sugar transport system ATPase subunit
VLLEQLTKSYGGRRVLDGVTLDVAPGEIHAVLGPNGSGKSTLIGCLSGAVIPDRGHITIDAVTRTHFTPREAIGAGIAVIYQHFSLTPTLTVAENIFLGSEEARGGLVRRSSQRRRATQILEQLGHPIHPDAVVATLSVGEQQLVEIAKALRHRPRVLVLDEPTAAIGQKEAARLGGYLKRLSADGMAIIYVTHLLHEVFEIAHRVTVLRDGRVVLSRPVDDVAEADLVSAIAPAAAEVPARARHRQPGEVVLELSELRADGVGPLTLTLRRGEAVGIFGLLGSGRTEILEAIFGNVSPTAGRAHVHGRLFAPREPADAVARGVALVPGERLRQSMFSGLTALDNVMLPYMKDLARFGLRRVPVEKAQFDEVARFLKVSPARPEAPGWTFSGGNQQKLVIGRWLAPASRSEILLLDEPTQGIDVGARRDLYRLLRDLVDRAALGLLFTSSDPDEVRALADRALVLHRGQVIAQLDPSGFDDKNLLTLAHGSGRAARGSDVEQQR